MIAKTPMFHHKLFAGENVGRCWRNVVRLW
jgi:hypothetical protein